METTRYAVIAGACAAMSSVFGKMVVISELPSINNTYMNAIIRLACFSMTFVMNTFMWAAFSRSLRSAQSSSHATVINSASNFCLTAVLGWGLFGERLTTGWWLGAALILGGSYLVHLSQSQPSSGNKKSQ
jgi:uncharacterized membrane protein